MSYSPLLNGAYDIHVHSSPDVIPRRQNPVEIVHEAQQAKMAGMLLKDHTTSTAGRVSILNQCMQGEFKFFSSLCLNPPVGDLNPSAVESSLREGVDVIFFPTYGARHHISVWGAGLPPTAFPFSTSSPSGTSILDPDGSLLEVCGSILKQIIDYDVVLATGHISPEESVQLVTQAHGLGCKKIIVTHASESVTHMTPFQQKEAVKMGAYIEHCFFAVTPACPDPVTLEEIGEQIRHVGAEHVILSSDFGQSQNLPPVEGFSFYLEKMKQIGFSPEEIRQMVCENPKSLFSKN